MIMIGSVNTPTNIVLNPDPVTYNSPGTYTFTVPAGVTQITVDVWGAGGRGGSRTSGSNAYGGGGGGAYSQQTIQVTGGQTYTVFVGQGSSTSAAGQDSWMSVNTVGNSFVLAKGGASVPDNNISGALGGAASAGIGLIKYDGGRGSDRISTTAAGGGGSAAGLYAIGVSATTSAGAIAPTGGGNGGAGRTATNGNGIAGTQPGGGGGGSYRTSTNTLGGTGGHGRVVINMFAGEICNNNIDDDGDGYIDSQDSDCGYYCATGAITVQKWLNVPGVLISDLTVLTTFPNSPTETSQVTSFQGPIDAADNYGSRVRGAISPTITGYYTFNLTSDDAGELYLSTDASPNNKVLVASVAGWTGVTEYTKYTTQTTAEIYLIAGQNYYVELLHKEGSGGDHFQVYWKTPVNSSWTIIPGSNLRPVNCGEICGNGFDDDGDGLIDCLDPDCGYITNGEFDNSTNNWNFSTQLGATGTLSIDNTSKLSGVNSAKAIITATSGTEWHAQLMQSGKSIVQNQNYIISFDAVASSNRNISVALQLGQSPWTNYFYQSSAVTTTKKSFSYEFTANTTVTDLATIIFNLSSVTGTVWIDNVQFRPVCDAFVSCETPTFSFRSPTLISGTAGEVGAKYKFTNVLPTTDAEVTIMARSHTDIVLMSLDEPAATNGGYDDAFQPIIDYNWYNSPGSSDPAGEKNITFKFNFYEAGTSTPKNVPQINMTALDVDGDGVTIREFAETSSFDAYQLQSPTTLSLTGSLKAKGALPAFPGVDETDLTGMISFIFTDENSITVTYGGDYSGVYYEGSGGEERLNSLYFKCYQFNTAVACPSVSVDGTGNICPGQSIVLTSDKTGSVGNCILQWQSSTDQETWVNIPGANSDTYTTGPIFQDVYYRAIFECDGRPECGQNLSNVKIIVVQPKVNITGASSICVGNTTTLSPTTGGTWTSSNTAVATVTNAGVVTGVSAGTATFTFFETSSGCTSSPTLPVTILAKPTVSITGAAGICIGATTTLSPTTGGTWTSSNAAIATVTNAGVVTGVSAGTATFTFTNTSSGCVSNATSPISVSAKPTVSISGPTTICVGSTTTLSPTTGGTWSSSNAAVATVTNAGVVTGVSAGTATFIFTNTAGCASNGTAAITINARPTVSITGPTSICVGATTTLSPTTGGTWASSNTAVATVTNAGVVTGVSAGTATFTFTNTAGCASIATAAITINARPTVSITGPTAICVGATTTLSPTTGGTWVSSNTAVATVTNAGVVTGVGAGTATFTFTNTAGCVSIATAAITINARPTVSITGPTSICVGVTTTLSPTTGGTWASSNTAVATVTNAGVVTGVSAGTATFTFTNTAGCASIATAAITINARPTVSITGPTSICVGATTTLSPTTGGTWASSNTAVATVTNAGVVTGVSAGTATFTFTNTAGCASIATAAITINARPIISNPSTSTLCVGSTLAMTPNTGGSWQSTNPSVASISNSGLVTALSVGTTSFIFTNAVTGCSSNASSALTVVNQPTVSIDYNGSVCLTNNSQLTAVANNGSGPYNYTWTGPNSFSGSTQTISITANGNYYVTLVDNNGCSASTSGFVYQKYEPFIANLVTEVCEGNTVTLTVNATDSPTYLWSANAGNATTSQVTVTPAVPSSQYFVTVTNNVGCTSVLNANIIVKARPITNITGSNTICIGQTTTLSPSSGGTWVSSNNAIATVTNTGLVTGVSVGTATFIFTNTAGCASNASLPITINALPNAGNDINNVNCYISGQATMQATGTGTWTLGSGSAGTVTIQNVNSPTTVVSGFSQQGTYNLVWTNAQGCSDIVSINVGGSCGCPINNNTIQNTMSSTYCGTSGSIQLTGTSPTPPNGTYLWEYSFNNGVFAPASGINNTKDYLTSSLSVGNHRFRRVYTTTTGIICSDNGNLITINVSEIPQVNLNGNSSLCVGQSISILPNTGGTWVSSNPTIASINNAGLVTALSAGSVQFTFTNSVSGCSSAPSSIVTIHAKPVAVIPGDAILCIGSTMTMSPNSGGTWQSTNPSVATINNSGQVTPVSVGNVTFIFTNTAGCISDPSASVAVVSKPQVSIDYNGSACLKDDSQLTALVNQGTAPYAYAWTGPNSFTGSTATIDITQNGNYYVTVLDDNGCSASASGFVYQRYEPFIVNLQTQICEGNDITLSVNASGSPTYLWSANAANATSQQVTVTPSLPSSTYYVTVTNNLGCSTVLDAVIDVYPKPSVAITGSNSICIGSTTQLSPTSGGTWSSNNPAVASVNNAGIVTGLSMGSATFTFTNSVTGCVSNSTLPITVDSKPATTITGSNVICVGSTTTLSPSLGGTWISNNPAVATITNSGLVTAVSQGTATFTYTESGSGCTSNPSAPVTVGVGPNVSIVGDDILCTGFTTQLSPSSGGVWTSSHPSIATVNNAGLVTAVSPGTVSFIFTNSSTNCTSLPTDDIVVSSKPVVSITGATLICEGGTTQLSPTSGGMWISSNNAIAIVSSSGQVTALAAGMVTFSFIDFTTMCTSDPTAPITVAGRPATTLTGAGQLCIGSTTSFSPSVGGTWVSNNPTIATITNAGVVTALAAGQATFKFTNISTGCISANTAPIAVYAKPVVTINGLNSICIGGSTSLSPSTGGTWASTNPSVATISNNGVVTGISSGTATFIFTETSSGCISNPSAPITIGQKPNIALLGAAELCINGTTSFSPSTGGSWTSSNPNVATITNTGVVTAIGQGSVTFVFTTDGGCTSDPSIPIIIHGRPIINELTNNGICIGSTLNLSASNAGTWTSSNPSVATINNQGVVTAIAAGTAFFTLQDGSTGCISNPSQLFTIHAKPTISLIGPSQICIGSTTNLSPTTGGVWISNQPTIASINNSGVVTGLNSGNATFSFTQNSTGCTSDGIVTVTVNTKPAITSDFNTLCVGATNTLSPTSGGTWTSLNPSIASVTASGVVTGLQQGITRFTFTSASSGCTSNQSNPVIIVGKPSIALTGPADICIGATTSLFPSTGGTWISNQPSVATITNDGVVTGVAVGEARFAFQESFSGCLSEYSSPIHVLGPIEVSITGPTNVCLGYTTQLSPSTGGIWMSTNPAIAKVNNSGMVTGIAPGKVSFYFMDNITGCISTLPDDVLTIKSCIDPDFNVTTVGVQLSGNVKTNDEIPVGTTYGQSMILVSKPSGSISNLVVNADGSYTFTGDKVGVYTYNVSVCLPTYVFGCPTSQLIITVIDPLTGKKSIVPNLDIATTFAGQALTIHTMANDKCINGVECQLYPENITITKTPNNGLASIDASGNIIYTPNQAHVGMDTLIYRVCSDVDPSNCMESKQIITINAVSAINSTVAADDFFSVYQGYTLNGNVLINDSDPENDGQTIVAQGSMGNPMSVSSGSYYLSSNGQLTFTPNQGFTGPVDIVYTVCDQNTTALCVSATAHILVLRDMTLQLRVYLEGALIDNGGQKASDNRPLMRDNLRNSPFNGANYIPVKDPYSFATTNVDVTSKFTHVGPGLLPRYQEIIDSAAVFSITGQNAIVDWVFVELRSKSNFRTVIATRSGLLQRDGDIVDVNGVSPLAFSGVLVDSCYVVIRHRNHLGVMSQKVSTRTLVDFTKNSQPVFDYGTSLNNGYDYTGLALKDDVVFGYRAMWAGDFDANGKIKFVNPGDDQNVLFFDVFAYPTNVMNTSNYNFTYGYFQGDFDMNAKSKYDNPNDDKNYLFSQLLLHPLNIGLLSNFNFVIEQVPSGL